MIGGTSVARRLAAAAALLGAALALSIAVGLATGAVGMTPQGILADIQAHVLGDGTGAASVIWDLRLPRVLLAAVIGAMLAAGGAALQGLLGNPLAEPYTVGVSSGCVLGASVAMSWGLDALHGGWLIPLAAFVTGAAAVALVFAMARRAGRLDVNTFLLSGIIVGSLFWAVTTFILSASHEDIARIFLWLAGSLTSPDPWTYLGICWKVAAVALAGLFWFARDLNAFALGEEQARQLGVEPERLKAWVIGLVTLGTAACVAAAGVIGFVGLIVPHGMRRLFGADQRTLLVSSALAGACLLVLADALARGLAPPREIPIGVITAAVGAPIFLAILTRKGA
jgi:iron complex transport system permease protein